MSIDTLRHAAQRLVDDGLAGRELTVVWHAGEPLVMPIDFYRQAFEMIAGVLGATTSVSHALQTNATLIDAALVRIVRAAWRARRRQHRRPGRAA